MEAVQARVAAHDGAEESLLVMTGRHMALRVDGNNTDNVSFGGGPSFNGRAASGCNETAAHPGNVLYPQAVLANKVYQMIDPRHQDRALVMARPDEAEVGFRGRGGMCTGIPVAELADEHKNDLQKTLRALIEPFRQAGPDEALEALPRQGGLDNCRLTFSKEEAVMDGTWESWRLEGPAFACSFRGAPHVHAWVEEFKEGHKRNAQPRQCQPYCTFPCATAVSAVLASLWADTDLSNGKRYWLGLPGSAFRV